MNGKEDEDLPEKQAEKIGESRGKRDKIRERK